MQLDHGKIEDAVVRAVIQDDDGIDYRMLSPSTVTAFIDTRQVVDN